MSVRLEWHSTSEHLAGTVPFALLVVPEGPEHHRVYFAGGDRETLAQAVASVMSYAFSNGRVMERAVEILSACEPGEFRATRPS